MKRRIFALLCVIALCVPAAVNGAGPFWCKYCETDENDGNTEGIEVKTDEYIEDGRLIEKGYYICSECGNQYDPPANWRRDLGPAPTPTDPPEDDQETNPPADSPQDNSATDPVTDPQADSPQEGQPVILPDDNQSENTNESQQTEGGETKPEEPVSNPSDEETSAYIPPVEDNNPGEVNIPVVNPEPPAVPPSQPAEVTNPPAATDPPVIIFTDPPVETEVPAPETQMPDTLSPETMMPVINENTPAPVTNPPEQITTNPPAANVPAAGEYDGRNYRKYPLFSRAFPSRRLNLEGDPDAFAEVPGVCIIENADLQKLLEVAFGI